MSSNNVIASFPKSPVWPSGKSRALWLQQALSAAPEAPERTPLPARADLCVIGGGFTGLWAALAAKRRDPSLDVVLVDGDICGGGASGRNGGFVMTAWSKFSSLKKVCGEADALRYGQACEDAVGAIGGFLDEHGIDGEFNQAGWLWVATNERQLGAWDAAVEAVTAAGVSPYELLTADEVFERSGTRTHLAGVYEKTPATFHPAKVAFGLADAARRLGITVVERTQVHELSSGAAVTVSTDHGSLQAQKVLLTVNAWAAVLPEIRHALVVTSSDIVATVPARAKLDEIGWPAGLSISDSRRLVGYYHRTADDRAVFGKGGGQLAFRGQVADGFHGDSARSDEVSAALHRTYPRLLDVPIAQSWRGPIDYSVSGLPFVFEVGGDPSVLAATGFSGNGCGPSYVVGDALAAMALGQDAEVFPEALRRIPRSPLPPEPVRYLGGRLVREAIARKEKLEDDGRRVDKLTSTFAALDPTGFVDRGES